MLLNSKFSSLLLISYNKSIRRASGHLHLLTSDRSPKNLKITLTRQQQQAFANYFNLTPQNNTQTLASVISEAEKTLGQNVPYAASIKGMQKLLDSHHFKKLVKSQANYFYHYLQVDHNLVEMGNKVMKHTAPHVHPNSSAYPVPLPFRGLVITLLGGLLDEGSLRSVSETSVTNSNSKNTEKLSTVQTVAEINGLIEAALNIHRNICNSTTDKITNGMNKMAVLVGDYCLAKACQLLSGLSSPEAVEKISSTLSVNSQRASLDLEHSNLLLKNCCETLVIISEQNEHKQTRNDETEMNRPRSSRRKDIANFAENLNNAHNSLLDNKIAEAFHYKNACLQFLHDFETTTSTDKNETATSEDYRILLINLVNAFLPVEEELVK